ncbi:MAG: zinc metallopeptidase [Anaerolineae bacterium]
MPFMYYDPLYFILGLPALLLGLYAQFKVQTTFQKYLRTPNAYHVTGARAAQVLLSASGLSHIEVEGTPGQLSDHYDPRRKVLRLSENVARSPSVASVAVVAHEVGHAVQDASNYGPMKLRTGIVPAVQIGSWLGPVLFFLGYLFASPQLATIGVISFAGAAVFALVTLPVELNASSRALGLLQSTSLIAPDELPGARQVLNAAALTYVAALMQALSQLLYFVLLLSGMRRRD